MLNYYQFDENCKINVKFLNFSCMESKFEFVHMKTESVNRMDIKLFKIKSLRL